MVAKGDRVGLPARPFFYTLEQIGALLQLSDSKMKLFIFYEGRTIIVRNRGHLQAVNIANDDQEPEWRVIEEELIRWMKYKGFQVYVTRLARTPRPTRELFNDR